ncbi:hypothetical protein COBT_002204 [Conglomerata obtusa]
MIHKRDKTFLYIILSGIFMVGCIYICTRIYNEYISEKNQISSLTNKKIYKTTSKSSDSEYKYLSDSAGSANVHKDKQSDVKICNHDVNVLTKKNTESNEKGINHNIRSLEIETISNHKFNKRLLAKEDNELSRNNNEKKFSSNENCPFLSKEALIDPIQITESNEIKINNKFDNKNTFIDIKLLAIEKKKDQNIKSKGITAENLIRYKAKNKKLISRKYKTFNAQENPKNYKIEVVSKSIDLDVAKLPQNHLDYIKKEVATLGIQEEIKHFVTNIDPKIIKEDSYNKTSHENGQKRDKNNCLYNLETNQTLDYDDGNIIQNNVSLQELGDIAGSPILQENKKNISELTNGNDINSSRLSHENTQDKNNLNLNQYENMKIDSLTSNASLTEKNALDLNTTNKIHNNENLISASDNFFKQEQGDTSINPLNTKHNNKNQDFLILARATTDAEIDNIYKKSACDSAENTLQKPHTEVQSIDELDFIEQQSDTIYLNTPESIQKVAQINLQQQKQISNVPTSVFYQIFLLVKGFLYFLYKSNTSHDCSISINKEKEIDKVLADKQKNLDDIEHNKNVSYASTYYTCICTGDAKRFEFNAFLSLSLFDYYQNVNCKRKFINLYILQKLYTEIILETNEDDFDLIQFAIIKLIKHKKCKAIYQFDMSLKHIIDNNKNFLLLNEASYNQIIAKRYLFVHENTNIRCIKCFKLDSFRSCSYIGKNYDINIILNVEKYYSEKEIETSKRNGNYQYLFLIKKNIGKSAITLKIENEEKERGRCVLS